MVLRTYQDQILPFSRGKTEDQRGRLRLARCQFRKLVLHFTDACSIQNLLFYLGHKEPGWDRRELAAKAQICLHPPVKRLSRVWYLATHHLAPPTTPPPSRKPRPSRIGPNAHTERPRLGLAGGLATLPLRGPIHQPPRGSHFPALSRVHFLNVTLFLLRESKCSNRKIINTQK